MTVISVKVPTDLAAWYAVEARRRSATINDMMAQALAEYRTNAVPVQRRPEPEPAPLVESPFGGGY